MKRAPSNQQMRPAQSPAPSSIPSRTMSAASNASSASLGSRFRRPSKNIEPVNEGSRKDRLSDAQVDALFEDLLESRSVGKDKFSEMMSISTDKKLLMLRSEQKEANLHNDASSVLSYSSRGSNSHTRAKSVAYSDNDTDSPEYHVRKLMENKHDITHIQKLSVQIRTKPIEWVKQFVAVQGHMAMLSSLSQINQKHIVTEEEQSLEHQLVSGFKGLFKVPDVLDKLQDPKIIECLIRSLVSERLQTRRLASEILTYIIARDGPPEMTARNHALVYHAFDHNAKIDVSNQRKTTSIFYRWIKAFINSLDNRTSRSTPLRNTDTKSAGMTSESVLVEYAILTLTFIKALVSPQFCHELQLRQLLRRELNNASLKDAFDRIYKLESSKANSLIAEYEDWVDEDIYLVTGKDASSSQVDLSKLNGTTAALISSLVDRTQGTSQESVLLSTLENLNMLAAKDEKRFLLLNELAAHVAVSNNYSNVSQIINFGVQKLADEHFTDSQTRQIYFENKDLSRKYQRACAEVEKMQQTVKLGADGNVGRLQSEVDNLKRVLDIVRQEKQVLEENIEQRDKKYMADLQEKELQLREAVVNAQTLKQDQTAPQSISLLQKQLDHNLRSQRRISSIPSEPSTRLRDMRDKMEGVMAEAQELEMFQYNDPADRRLEDILDAKPAAPEIVVKYHPNKRVRAFMEQLSQKINLEQQSDSELAAILESAQRGTKESLLEEKLQRMRDLDRLQLESNEIQQYMDDGRVKDLMDQLAEALAKGQDKDRVENTIKQALMIASNPSLTAQPAGQSDGDAASKSNGRESSDANRKHHRHKRTGSNKPLPHAPEDELDFHGTGRSGHDRKPSSAHNASKSAASPPVLAPNPPAAPPLATNAPPAPPPPAMAGNAPPAPPPPPAPSAPPMAPSLPGSAPDTPLAPPLPFGVNSPAAPPLPVGESPRSVMSPSPVIPAATPRIKLKRIHWEKLDDVEQTIWRRELPPGYPNMLDLLLKQGVFDEVERLFAAKEIRRIKNSNKRKEDKVSFLAPEISQNFDINLHFYANMSVEETVADILKCSDEFMQHVTIIEFFNSPQANDIPVSLARNLQPYSQDWSSGEGDIPPAKDPNTLARGDQLFLELTFNLQYYWTIRNRALLMCVSFESDYDRLFGQLTAVHDCCNSIIGSNNFYQLMKLILVVGNHMNGQGRQVEGFRLGTLQRLAVTKDETNSMTFLHYVERIVRTGLTPELDAFSSELAQCSFVSRMSIDNLKGECQEYATNIRNIQNSVDRGKLSDSKKFHPKDRFMRQVLRSLKDAREKAQLLTDFTHATMRRLEQAMQLYGEDPNDAKAVGSFFEKFAIFVKEYRQARTENEARELEQRAYEQRRKLIDSPKKIQAASQVAPTEASGERQNIDSLLEKLKAAAPSPARAARRRARRQPSIAEEAVPPEDSSGTATPQVTPVPQMQDGDDIGERARYLLERLRLEKESGTSIPGTAQNSAPETPTEPESR